jgi:hypothetical protein
MALTFVEEITTKKRIERSFSECLNNAACAHLKVSVSSGPEAPTISSTWQNVIICLGTILDKGLHVIHPKWKLPMNLMNLLLKSTLKGHIHGTKGILG